MSSVYTLNCARFTVITEGIIRCEYSADETFVDAPTLLANRTGFSPCAGTVSDGCVTICTGKIRLSYTENGKPFEKENLSAQITCGDFCCDWYFGKPQTKNLKGTLVTLDGVDGFRDTPDGLISRDGWVVIDDSGSPVLSDGWIANRSENHKQDIYLLAYGLDYKQALRDFAVLSGDFALPRKYFFGSWYSRWWAYTEDDFRKIVDEYEEHGFPLDILVMDMDWHYSDWHYAEGDPKPTYGHGHAGGNLGWSGYSWQRRYLPHAEELLRELAEKGIRVTLNDHPADGVRDTDEVYPGFAADMGLNAEKKENIPFNAGDQKYMEAFFRNAHHHFEEQGVSFWWLDWQQDYLFPEVPGVKGLSHLPWLNRLYFENSRREGRRGQSFSRWGGFGDHKHPAYFSGDCVSTWEALAYEVQMTVSAANAGCFWWSHDIGGFQDVTKSDELYVRWVQFGAVSAALRLHMCGEENFDRRPWTWGERACGVMREMFRLRSRLFPYIYSSAYRSAKEALPLLKPMYYENPETEEAYRYPDQYYFGPDMIASPVTEKGAGQDCTAEKEIYLPDGIWYDWFSGARFAGSTTVTVSSPLETFPLFVRGNAGIVSQPYTNRMASAPLQELILTVFDGGEGTHTTFLYEDDGESCCEENGAFLKTEIETVREADRLILRFRPSGNGFSSLPEKRNLTLIFKGFPEFEPAVSGSFTLENGREIKMPDVNPRLPLELAYTFTV